MTRCLPIAISWRSSPALPEMPRPACPRAGNTAPTSSRSTRKPPLLAAIAALPLEEARYRGYVARRRVAHFGTDYDYGANRLLPSAAAAGSFRPLRERAAAWIGEPPRRSAAPSSPSTGRACRSAGIATSPTSRPSSASPSAASRGCAFAAIRRSSRRRRRALARARAALGLPAARRGALGLAAQHRADAGLRWSITFRTRVAAGSGRRAATPMAQAHDDDAACGTPLPIRRSFASPSARARSTAAAPSLPRRSRRGARSARSAANRSASARRASGPAAWTGS